MATSWVALNRWLGVLCCWAMSAGLVQAESTQTQPWLEEPYSREALIGKIRPSKLSEFVLVEAPYTTRSSVYLRREAFQAFQAMHHAAAKQGVRLEILSGFRSFWHQSSIWLAKWDGKRLVRGSDLSQTHPHPQDRAAEILKYSAMPGTSRHHWGTEVDLNAFSNRYFEVAGSEGAKVYAWLQQNARSFGFCRVYSEVGPNRPKGYLQEKWHWSYQPIAYPMQQAYERSIHHQDLNGFPGSDQVEGLHVLEHYVQGVDPACAQPMEPVQ